jgi:hypothetical protein
VEEIEKIALLGQAKFTEGDATPYSAIVRIFPGRQKSERKIVMNF